MDRTTWRSPLRPDQPIGPKRTRILLLRLFLQDLDEPGSFRLPRLRLLQQEQIPPTTAPPPRPSYDKPAPPRKVVDHAYDYPEFVAAPNPAPPLGQSYFGVDLGSLSDPEEIGSGQGTSTSSSSTTPKPTPPPTVADQDDQSTADPAEKREKTTASLSSIFVLQLIKLVRWPLVALILIAVLGSCLLSGCSVGIFGRR